jgi:hypothetical protein
LAAPEKWLRSRLAQATTAGIHPVLAAQNSPFPLVVYRRTGTKRERGVNAGNFGVPVATFSVSVVSETYTQAKDIADAIRLSVDNFTGQSDGARILLASLVGEQDNMERPPEGQSKPLYRVDQVYEVRFHETV